MMMMLLLLLLLLLVLRIVLIHEVVRTGYSQRISRRHWHMLVVTDAHELAGEGCGSGSRGFEYEV